MDKRFRDASNTPSGYPVRARSPRRYSARGRSGQARRRLGVDYAPSAMPVVGPWGRSCPGPSSRRCSRVGPGPAGPVSARDHQRLSGVLGETGRWFPVGTRARAAQLRIRADVQRWEAEQAPEGRPDPERPQATQWARPSRIVGAVIGPACAPSQPQIARADLPAPGAEAEPPCFRRTLDRLVPT